MLRRTLRRRAAEVVAQLRPLTRFVHLLTRDAPGAASPLEAVKRDFNDTWELLKARHPTEFDRADARPLAKYCQRPEDVEQTAVLLMKVFADLREQETVRFLFALALRELPAVDGHAISAEFFAVFLTAIARGDTVTAAELDNVLHLMALKGVAPDVAVRLCTVELAMRLGQRARAVGEFEALLGSDALAAAMAAQDRDAAAKLRDVAALLLHTHHDATLAVRAVEWLRRAGVAAVGHGIAPGVLLSALIAGDAPLAECFRVFAWLAEAWDDEGARSGAASATAVAADADDVGDAAPSDGQRAAAVLLPGGERRRTDDATAPAAPGAAPAAAGAAAPAGAADRGSGDFLSQRNALALLARSVLRTSPVPPEAADVYRRCVARGPAVADPAALPLWHALGAVALCLAPRGADSAAVAQKATAAAAAAVFAPFVPASDVVVAMETHGVDFAALAAVAVPARYRHVVAGRHAATVNVQGPFVDTLTRRGARSVREARDALEERHQGGERVGRGTVNAVLAASAALGDAAETLALVDAMGDAFGVAPDATAFGYVVAATAGLHAGARRVWLATLRTMRERRVAPTATTVFDPMASLALAAGHVDDAAEVARWAAAAGAPLSGGVARRVAAQLAALGDDEAGRAVLAVGAGALALTAPSRAA